MNKIINTKNHTRQFYDELAKDYHLIFEDWQTSVKWQAKILKKLLKPPPCRVLDVACGMGTQAIGLARHGYEVVGRDLSAALIKRAKTYQKQLGIDASFSVGDMKDSVPSDQENYDVVLAFDNALPHLQNKKELKTVLYAAKKALRAQGAFYASLRDYDTLHKEKPRLDPPRILGKGHHERIVFQLWHWEDDGEAYELEHILLTRNDQNGWDTTTRKAWYRALQRKELEACALEAGFDTLQWLEPPDSGFYQPVFVAKLSK